MPKVKSYHCSDVGNARFFRDFVAGNLIYNWRTQLWYEWTGKRWSPCLNGQSQEWGKRAVREMLKFATTIGDANKRTSYAKWSLSSESDSRLTAMLKLARSEKTISDSGELWDADPFHLGCPAGVLDLRTGNFIQADRAIRLTNAIVIDPDDKAKAPVWERTLEEIYEGDVELIAFIKRFLGYSLAGSVEEQCVLCLYGIGANGKSTITDAIRYLMGGYGYAMPFSTIEFNTRSAISNDMAALYGKRYVVASETQEGVRLNEGRLKSLTGGDMVTARFMYKEYFSFKPSAHFILAFNHKPLITDDSEGAWRRIHLVKHNRVFKAHERDKKLDQKLIAEMPGILNWLIEGCLEWQRDGLRVPRSVELATEEYRREMNPLTRFLDDECTLAPNVHIGVTELWDSYGRWVNTMDEKYKLPNRRFNERLESMGYERKSVKIKGSVVKCWIGITLADDPRSNQGIVVDVVN